MYIVIKKHFYNILCYIKGIQLGMDIGDILKEDLEIFEVSGAPIKGIPKKARERVQNQVKLIAIR